MPSERLAAKLAISRQALLPFFGLEAGLACGGISWRNPAGFEDFLVSNDLAAAWHYSLHKPDRMSGDNDPLPEVLRHARRASAAAYLGQRTALVQLDALFEAHGIAYVVMKGAHVREQVYPDPSLRMCSDLDVLVAQHDRHTAAKLLLKAGYAANIDPTNISHEASFSRASVHVDLHWDILRPGRTRINLTRQLIARRQRSNGFWGLSDSDTVFLMLTHPAFAKYVCSPNMGLARVADFLLWIQHKQVDWPEVLRLLEQAGLRNAAWMMLTWFNMLAPHAVQQITKGWVRDLKPGRLRAAYLQYWLEHDLPTRWLQRPLLIQLGLTMFLHDSLECAWHALKGWRLARQSAATEMRAFEEALGLGA